MCQCGESSDPFPVTSRAKQDCVLAPTALFSILQLDAFKDMDKGVYIQFRTDGGLFNLKRLQSRTKILRMLFHDFLIADDCALVAHTV